jgi:hypothetical protein
MSYLNSEPCINYERSWDTTETERTVALIQVWDNVAKSKVDVPIDDNTKGIEHLVMVTNEEFKLACEELQFEDEDLTSSTPSVSKAILSFIGIMSWGKSKIPTKLLPTFPLINSILLKQSLGKINEMYFTSGWRQDTRNCPMYIPSNIMQEPLRFSVSWMQCMVLHQDRMKLPRRNGFSSHTLSSFVMNITLPDEV